MCISTTTLAVFLNLLDPSIITTAPGEITVNASEGTAVWTATAEDVWCTDAPVRDMEARFKAVE